MKKTLVALAVLAASGASFAQVTVTGSYIAGYEAKSNVYYGSSPTSGAVGGTTLLAGGKNTGDTSGLGIDTSAVTFTAMEDLGGGLSAKAVMSFDGLTRAGVGGGDSFVALSGSFGTVTLGNGRGSDYLSGGVSGAGGVGMDDKIFTRLDASDYISYKTPNFSGFTFSITADENAIDRADEVSGSDLGLGVGAAGTPKTKAYQRDVNYSLTYSVGPIAANLAYKSWDQQGKAGFTDNNSTDRVSLAGSYNFGVAKVGAGYRKQNFVTGYRQDTFLAVGMPLGALTLGADYASRQHTDTINSGSNTVQPITTGTKTGYGVKAEYALSKRTSIIASYASWEAYVGVDSRTTDTNLLVSHSF